ncbi:MAG TPA: ubiquinol-cytochrome c reductase iron-sulfur subunit [Alphaproteobacteria bacterium]|nr:ubiquinol-cytochrome c reductase iron-sulfur subunit [Alphaproteobacteria bacterium]
MSDSIVDEGQTRRDFLFLTAATTGVVATAAVLWAMVDSMEPSADVIAAGAPLDVDISQIKPGQQIVVLWRAHPVYIANRTQPLLDRLQHSDTSRLSDPDSDVMQQPDYAKNWHRSIKPEYLVLVGICTHLGCLPRFEPDPGGALGADWPGGYFCPCHGSRYDLAARVFKGVPAPYNLPVPPHRFVDDKTLRIGENPPNTQFDFDDIVQM